MFIKKNESKSANHRIDYGFYTHIAQRQHNQDSILVSPKRASQVAEERLFAVADGMSGHAGGALASRLACDGLAYYFEKYKRKELKESPLSISRQLSEAIMRIDRSIRIKGLKDSKYEDMGSTLSCLVITSTHSIIAHVGDTRIYRLRNGYLSILTVDHTFVQDMIFDGEVDPEKAQLHPLRHVLTRAVGTGEPLQIVDCRIDRVQIGDKFLLCSDGLYNTITIECIFKMLTIQSGAAEIAKELVTSAYDNGASDNITAIVVKVGNSESGCISKK